MELNNLLNDIYNDYDINKHKMNKFKLYFRNLFYLFKTTMFAIRESWLWYLLMICITPIGLMITLGIYFQNENIEIMEFIVSGNMIMSLVSGTMLTLGQTLGYLKEYKGFDYYAVLPISKASMIIAYVMRAVILSLPSLLIIYIIGAVLFNLHFAVHPIIILVIILSGLSLSGIGAIIGIFSKNMQTASLLTQIVQPVIVFLAPVLIPKSVLPMSIKYISVIMPTTYISEAFRAALNNRIALSEIIILTVISIVSVYLVTNKLDWSRD